MPLVITARQGPMRKDKDPSAKQRRHNEGNTGEMSTEGRCIVTQKKQTKQNIPVVERWKNSSFIWRISNGHVIQSTVKGIIWVLILKYHSYTWKEFLKRLD